MTDLPELTFYKEYPKNCDPEDFWGQVKRTINNQPVPQEQIDMIVQATATALELSKRDILLDLCCGNGALTTYFFEKCNGGIGVDFSEFLIDVARRHFIKGSNEKYILQDILDFARDCPDPKHFNKALCYGSIQYLPRETAYELLFLLRKRFTGINLFFIGNIPDKQFVRSFFGKNYKPGIEDSPANAIGIWWSQEEFNTLAEKTGWNIDIRNMPKEFHWSHYRYDAVLTPA